MKQKPSALQNRRRKPKNTEENLSERITFRLSSTEKNQLTAKATERGIRLSLLCHLIVTRRRIPDYSPETRQWIRGFISMKNNLNQIAHYVNTTKGCDDWVLDALHFITSEVGEAKNILTTNNNNENEQPL